MGDSLAIFIDRAKFYATDFANTICATVCKPSSELKINGRTYSLVRLLGEGGFSFVYLVRDMSSGREFAIKKIRCTTADQVQVALAEVEAMRRFKSPHIIRVLDSAVVQDESGEGKIVWVFLPFYKRGNLQDLITRSSATSPPSRPPEQQLLELFLGTAKGVQAMHRWKPSSADVAPADASTSSSYPPSASAVFSADDEGLDEHDDGEGGAFLVQNAASVARIEGPGEDTIDESGKGKGKQREVNHPGASENGIVPWAHRDIKPANVMIADDGSPILMDLGSIVRARVEIRSRQEALLQQDLASEHSSMPYRAPELFDVKTNTTLDEKVDIWALGCTLFALAYSHSPFEDPANQGGSISMSVASGSYRHPRDSPYSEGFKKLIDSMIVVDPRKRPDIDEVIARTRALQDA